MSWPEALDVAADTIAKATRHATAPASIAVLGGARGTNEDAYAWAMLAKGVIGTDNVDAQLGDGLPAELVLGMPRAEIADLDRASAIVLLGRDLRRRASRARACACAARCSSSACRSSTARRVAHKLSRHARVVARVVPGRGARRRTCTARSPTPAKAATARSS